MIKLGAKINANDAAFYALVQHLAERGHVDVDGLSFYLTNNAVAFRRTDPEFAEELHKIGQRLLQFKPDPKEGN